MGEKTATAKLWGKLLEGSSCYQVEIQNFPTSLQPGAPLPEGLLRESLAEGSVVGRWAAAGVRQRGAPPVTRGGLCPSASSGTGVLPSRSLLTHSAVLPKELRPPLRSGAGRGGFGSQCPAVSPGGVSSLSSGELLQVQQKAGPLGARRPWHRWGATNCHSIWSEGP